MSEKVNKALREFMHRNRTVHQYVGVVVDVDDQQFTCTVQPADGGAQYHGVRLKPVIDGEDYGVVCIPEIDSDVIYGVLKGDDASAYIIQFTKVKSYQVKTSSGATLLLKDGATIEINGDSFGGLVKVQKLVDRLNALEQKMNTHVHPGVSTGSGVTGTITPGMAQTQRSDIENEKVKHGG